MKPTLYLIRGIPGSGKTTFARKLLNANIVQAIHCADDYMLNAGGAYEFNPAMLTHCHEQCFQATSRALSQHKSVAVHNTFIKQWELERYHKLAASFDVSIVESVCQGRWPNTHGVPEEKVKSMCDSFEW